MEAFRYNRVVQALLQEREGVEIIEGHLMPDHIHMLVELPSSISVSEFVRVVKVESSKFLSDNYEDFPLFKGWAKEYCALTYSFRDRDVICNYIRNQQQHHLGESLYNELQRLLAENAIEYKSEYLFND